MYTQRFWGWLTAWPSGSLLELLRSPWGLFAFVRLLTHKTGDSLRAVGIKIAPACPTQCYREDTVRTEDGQDTGGRADVKLTSAGQVLELCELHTHGKLGHLQF